MVSFFLFPDFVTKIKNPVILTTRFTGFKIHPSLHYFVGTHKDERLLLVLAVKNNFLHMSMYYLALFLRYFSSSFFNCHYIPSPSFS